MDTIRKLLNNEEFDWENGIIIFNPKSSYTKAILYDHLGGARQVDKSDSILDIEFDSGAYTIPRIPPIVAKDNKYIYIIAAYVGNVWIDKVHIDISEYINEPIPMFGG